MIPALSILFRILAINFSSFLIVSISTDDFVFILLGNNSLSLVVCKSLRRGVIVFVLHYFPKYV